MLNKTSQLKKQQNKNQQSDMRRKTLNQIIVFTLTFLGYAALHSLRQGWSLSKAQIIDIKSLNTDKTYLGIVDTCYLLSYSFGMMVLGHLIHVISLKLYVGMGMILATVFYVLVPMYYQSYGEFNHAAVIVFMCLNGFFQSTGWPGLVGIMGNWFQKGKTGLILGIWAINANIGNIIAQIMCNILKNQFNVEWTYNFYSTGIFTLVVGVLIILFLKDEPTVEKRNPLIIKEGQQQEGEKRETQATGDNRYEGSLITEEQNDDASGQRPNNNTNNNTQAASSSNTQPKKISIFRSLCLPKVPSYVIGYSMLKGCIYGLLFWLPTYLNEKDLGDQNGYISAMVDTGSFIGGLIIGYLGDKLQLRALMLSPLLLSSSVVMFCSAYFLSSIAWQYYVAMFLVGITIGGPYNIIGAVITIDLGRQTKEMGGSTAAISSLIEGSAAVFAALSQLLIGALSEDFTFYIFFGECLIAAFVLFPLFLTEWKVYKQNKNNK